MKAQEYEKMEIEAKTFACSLLSDSSILSKKREKQIREYLKKNNFLKSDSESSVHQKIKVSTCQSEIAVFIPSHKTKNIFIKTF